ncbi:MAG: hypothetical protein ACI9H8_000298 [Lysobacterales bacterium]|jgi:hypothetical protein
MIPRWSAVSLLALISPYGARLSGGIDGFKQI